LEGGADLLGDGLVDDVLELELVLVSVFVEAVERVDVVEPVIVFVPISVIVVTGELLLVRVAAADLVGFFDGIAVIDESRFVSVGGCVGTDVADTFVDFVDVFECVELLDGAIPSISNKRPGRCISTAYDTSPPPFKVWIKNPNSMSKCNIAILIYIWMFLDLNICVI
jgi:hypothetical protein